MAIHGISALRLPPPGYGCREPNPAAPGFGPPGVHPQASSPSCAGALRLRFLTTSRWRYQDDHRSKPRHAQRQARILEIYAAQSEAT